MSETLTQDRPDVVVISRAEWDELLEWYRAEMKSDDVRTVNIVRAYNARHGTAVLGVGCQDAAVTR